MWTARLLPLRLLLSLLLARVLLLLVCRGALLWRQLELALDVSGAGRVDKCPSLTARVAVVPQDVVEVRPSEDGGGGCSSHGALMGAVAWKVMEDACSRQRVSHARTAGAFTFLCCSQRCGSRLCQRCRPLKGGWCACNCASSFIVKHESWAAADPGGSATASGAKVQ